MKITILLSTYNGEKYLKEQLDSILNQTYDDWFLLIRDDYSQDNTENIIEAYIKDHPNKIKKIKSYENIGVVKSFEELLKTCSSEYISFCDQDDIWFPTKLEESMKKMVELEKKHPEKPIAVFSDLAVVDENLNVIHPSFWEYSKIDPKRIKTFEDLCVRVVATGCTLLINKKAKDISLPFIKEVRMHDSWVLLNVLKCNGIIDYLNHATVLYRQHENNVVGAQNKDSISSKICNIGRIVEENKKQWEMINKLGFSSKLKYVYLKIKFHLGNLF